MTALKRYLASKRYEQKWNLRNQIAAEIEPKLIQLINKYES